MTWKISPFSLLNNNDDNNRFSVLGIKSHESHDSSEPQGQDTWANCLVSKNVSVEHCKGMCNK